VQKVEVCFVKRPPHFPFISHHDLFAKCCRELSPAKQNQQLGLEGQLVQGDHCISVVGLCGKVLVTGGLQGGGFCEKLLEASSLSDRASASQLQDRPAAGQGQAHQRQW